jgi:hypothetical protein
MATPKFDLQYKTDSSKGKMALEQMKPLLPGSRLTSNLIDSLAEPVEWKCTQHRTSGEESGRDLWVLESTFCGIPFYKLTVIRQADKIGMQVEEL